MKKIILTLLLASSSWLASHAAEPLTVAVFDFQTADQQLAKRGSEIAVLLNAKLSTASDLILVERQEIDKLLGEQEIGMTGTVTPDSAAKIGALLGAKVLVTGRLFDSGGKTYLVAKIISTETGRVYGEMTTIKDPGALDQGSSELAEKISALITKQSDTLTAKVEDPATRLERLKQIVAGKKLPAISVAITEQHINRQIPDPAVQTEFIRTLQQLGFDLITPGETVKRQPDLTISGEAFSESAMRRGNLVSCRARVEITVTDRTTGKLLLTDRQTGVAVDLAENIAAKQALENATAKLLERILPQLAK